MNLRCEAPGHKVGQTCGWYLGESREDLELVILSRIGADYGKLFPSPFRVSRCKCGWLSIYQAVLAENSQ